MGDRIHIHTHTCVRHYKSRCSWSERCALARNGTTRARTGAGELTHNVCTPTSTHSTRSEPDKQSLLLGWAPFAPPLSRTHRAPGWRRGPSVSQHCPLPRSLFPGMAAFSSWLDSSSLYADSKLLACQDFRSLPSQRDQLCFYFTNRYEQGFKFSNSDTQQPKCNDKN